MRLSGLETLPAIGPAVAPQKEKWRSGMNATNFLTFSLACRYLESPSSPTSMSPTHNIDGKSSLKALFDEILIFEVLNRHFELSDTSLLQFRHAGV